MRAATGRADLLYARAELGADTLPGVASLLGYEVRGDTGGVDIEVKPPEKTTTGPAPKPPVSGAGAPGPEAPVGDAPVPCWRVEAIDVLADDSSEDPFAGTEALTEAELSRPVESAPPPTAPALAPWSRLLPGLRRALRRVDRGEVDVESLVERWSRGERVNCMPRRERRGWSSKGVVVVDRSTRLVPFWNDQDDLVRSLQAASGGVEVRVLSEGPAGDVVQGGRSLPKGLDDLAADRPVLVLSDLGIYAGDVERAAWRRLAARLRRAGVRATALVPCPLERLRGGVSELTGTFSWEASGAYAALREPLPPSERAARAARLLRLLSPAVRIEPGFLREVRRLLPHTAADAGTEADVWVHPAVNAGGVAAAVSPERAGEWRRQLRDVEDPALRRQVMQALRRWRVHLPAEIWHEEVLETVPDAASCEAYGVPREDWDEACAYFSRVAAALAHGRLVPEARSAVESWFRRVAPRVPDEVWRQAAVGDALGLLWWRSHQGLEGAEVPSGVDLERLRRVAGSLGSPRRFSLQQVGGALQVLPLAAPGSSTAEGPGSALVDIELSLPYVQLERPGAGTREQVSVDAKFPPRFAVLPERGVVVRTDRVRVQLDATTKAPWAVELGRDEESLYAVYEIGKIRERLRWVPPRRRRGNSAATGGGVKGIWLGGAWPAAAQLARSGHEGGGTLDVPPWPAAVGRDEIGPWAAFEVGGVLHRLRRLSPGRFWMGSPRTEVGRSENEGPQHEVRLTRGFWLGETAVTQALWEAVMGTNPSRFPSPTRPVEQVSWNDAQEFLLRLEERVPGLGARLPSEAEWEYACRAGTTTSTYAGELEILEAFDCPQLDPIAWYGGNSGADQVLTKPGSSSQTSSDAGSAAGTYPAAEKAANPWGLYDMLGNVYEWCQDGLREYGEDSADSSENVVDPHGPAAGQGRVIRGGSWADVARHVRAASRFSRHPDARKDLLGFRLARSDDGTPASRRT